MPNGRDGYHDVLRTVLRRGTWSSPRGMRTLDAGEVTMVLESPYDALPLATGRGLSRRIAAAEALQLIGGFSLPELLPPAFDRFKEDDGRFWGAYGERIGNQLALVVRKLRSDRDGRQAVITLWDPMLDNVDPPKRDHPCTVALGFRIYRDKLTLRVLMRSSDCWLGIPYDWHQFTALQLSVANLLQVEPGPYTHTSWALHIYEEHIRLIHNLHPIDEQIFQPRGLDAQNVSSLMQRAWHIANGVELSNYTESEKWYADALA